MCSGVGTGDSCGGDISGGSANVFDFLFTDCLRLLLSETIGGEKMKVVVWKAPKMLRGVLKRFFGIRE